MASLASEQLSGLAKEIVQDVNQGDSEQYHLINYDETRINTLVDNVFSKPLRIPTGGPGMVRVTFVVGGGQKVRGKYHASCQKFLIAALRRHNYEDDQGAAMLPDSAGKYKTQHDTNLNLKFVNVFPFVVSDADPNSSKADGLEDTSSKTFMCMAAERATFERMVIAQVKYWRLKKTLVEHLRVYAERATKIEEKMMRMESMTPAEQQLYDVFDGPGVADKMDWLQNQMKKQVAAGELTEKEKKGLLSQVQEKIKSIETKLEESEESSLPEKVVKRAKAQLESLNKRKDHLSTIKGVVVPFANWEELAALAKQMHPHLVHEREGKTIKANEAAEMQDIRNKRAIVVEDARMWFESDADLEGRAETVERNYMKKMGRKGSSKKKTSGGSSSGGWSTVGSRRR